MVENLKLPNQEFKITTITLLIALMEKKMDNTQEQTGNRAKKWKL